MEKENIISVANMWNKKTYDILDLREIPIPELEELVRNTYEVLYEYQAETNIPKEICQVLLNEDEFMSFLAIMGSNQEELEKTARVYQELYCIIDTMKQKFFSNGFDEAFPKLQVNFNGENFELNMEEAFLENLSET
jgi:hypothetical protein